MLLLSFLAVRAALRENRKGYLLWKRVVLTRSSGGPSPLPRESGTVRGSNSENCARLILRTGVLRSGDARSF